MPHVYSLDGITPVVDSSAFVHPTAVLIGDVIIGPNCYIGPGASLRGDFGRIVFEEGSNLQDNCVVHTFPNAETIVERGGHIGHGAILHGCRIKQYAMVGMAAVIMDDAEIGESAVVAALTFVKAGMLVPARSLIAGTPGKVIRELTDGEIEWKNEGTAIYQALSLRCKASLREAEPLSEVEPGRQRMHVPQFEPLQRSKKNSPIKKDDLRIV
jgi:phenylacetic acid degradation protein